MQSPFAVWGNTFTSSGNYVWTTLRGMYSVHRNHCINWNPNVTEPREQSQDQTQICCLVTWFLFFITLWVAGHKDSHGKGKYFERNTYSKPTLVSPSGLVNEEITAKWWLTWLSLSNIQNINHLLTNSLIWTIGTAKGSVVFSLLSISLTSHSRDSFPWHKTTKQLPNCD